MPAPKRPGQAGATDSALVTPEEVASIRSSVTAKEQAPSSRVQAIFSNWREVADRLGDPFEVERVPISKLRDMRRDPMLGFGLSFIKTPHVRAKWFINAKDNNGPNAQIAAHLDQDLRRIWGSFVLQYMNSLDFGFQAIAKRFEFRTPTGTFIETNPDSGEQTESPIWSQGGIQPIAWKPFVPLRPEGVEPIWKGDDFNGIDYDPTVGLRGVAAASGSQQGGSKKYKIDLYHALWVTNEQASNFGSIFGYPRLAYAYRYWWSYWFRWAIADRAFEKKGDPSVIIYHPEEAIEHPITGEAIDAAEYALEMGERIRSGGVIALPSEPYEDVNGRGTTRRWEVDFTKDATNFDPFDKSFDYLDVQKVRSLWIPEQAFLEGKGGTSSRNVAKEMGESFIESQAVLNQQLVDTVNRFLIPQWLAVNYPDFVTNGGEALLVVTGFADEDIEFTREVIQLIGQQDSGAREMLKLVDLKRVLEDSGTPISDFASQGRKEAQLQQEAAAAAAPTVPAVPGQSVGTVPAPAAPGTAGAAGSAGFSYVQPREVIYLSSETGADFIDNLPASPHYEDKTIKGYARDIWVAYRDLYKDEYDSAIDAILESDEIEAADIELATPRQIANRMIEKWKGSDRWPSTLERSLGTMSRILKRASKLELKRVNLSSQIDEDAADEWLRQHLAAAASKVAETTRTEVRDFVERKVKEGVTDRQELGRLTREHFAEFPRWKADRLARTEVRDVYNAATLLAARSAGAKQVQALDARITENTDEDCVERDGRVFTVDDAFKETEHPNGTLAWRILPVELSIKKADMNGDGATFDNNVLTLSTDLSPEAERKILLSVVDSMIAG